MSWIAEKINKIRTDKGLTQEDLAEKSKLSLRTIQRIENGINTPRPKTLVMLCEALEIDSSELIPNKNVRSWAETLADGFFLIALNAILMGIFGFLTLDSKANLNTIFAAFFLSFFLHIYIVFKTPGMSGLERTIKFGFGYVAYFIIITTMHGFILGFGKGLFPCLLLSLTILYFGNRFAYDQDNSNN